LRRRIISRPAARGRCLRAERGERVGSTLREGRSLEIRHLRAFLAVAKHRSFTRAAHELLITQPAISQQIRVLEADLGTALFRREAHSIDLTDAGIALLPDAEEILRSVDYARTRLASRASIQGSIRVVTGTVASTVIYSGIYSRFVRQYPRIDLRVTVGVGIEVAPSIVQAGDADIAFVGFPVAAQSDLEAEVLGETELVAVAAPGERMTRVMSWDTSPSLRRIVTEAGVAVEVCTNDISLLKRFVHERAGLAIVPRWAVSGELEAGTFELVPLQLPPLREPMGIVYSRSRTSHALAAFLTVVHDYKPILKEICSGNTAVEAGEPVAERAQNSL
jgi:LysR family transcriptional regulator, low CO2-responsive transcriptional regulator